MQTVTVPSFDPMPVRVPSESPVTVQSPKETPVSVRANETQAKLWTPAQLGDDLALWLDVWDSPFETRTDTNDNERVEVWGDLSGNGYDASQSTGSEQPNKRSDVVYFDGTNFLTHEAVISQGRASGAFLAYVDDASDRGAILGGVGTSGSNNHYPFDGGQIYVDWGRNSRPGWEGSINLELPHIGVFINGSNWTARLAGSEQFSDSAKVSWGGSEWDIFRSTQQSNKIRAGGMYIYVISTDVSSETTKKLEGWGAHKADRHGISEPLNLLSDTHPYKNSPPTV